MLDRERDQHLSEAATRELAELRVTNRSNG